MACGRFVGLLVLLCGVLATPARADDVVVRALSLIGVPYRYGGEDPAVGLDCSGLVRHAFRHGAGMDLPRRSEDRGRVGTPVRRHELLPGDLVFFNTLGRPYSHVAIYIGDGRFVHAPTSRGEVRIEAMSLQYWNSRYNGARRVLAQAPSLPPAAIPPPPGSEDAYRGA